MPIPTSLKLECDDFFKENSHKFDMAHADECGRYMQELIPYLQDEGYDKVGFLRKNPGQTQYDGHAIDAFAYDLGDNLTHAIDVIGNAEQPHPWKSEDGTKDDPYATFNEDTATAYKTDKDWLEKPTSSNTPNESVPWVAYDEASFNDRLQQQLAYDYGRRPQAADFAVSVWSARVFHSTYMGPEGKPLGFDEALKKHRPEWCESLKVPVDDKWF